MNNRLSHRILLTAPTILLLCLSAPLFGERVCCEGEQWLRWSDDIRQTYVLAFTLGYSKGYVQGCDLGTRGMPPDSKPGIGNDPRQHCLHTGLDFSKGTDFFVKSITEFYERFPTDRDIYVEELIQCFASGLSVEEAHHHKFPSRDKTSPKH